MPMPITPQVPTSRRLRGLYMSMTPRARSSVLAPSLTRIASGRSLMTVRKRTERAVIVHRRVVVHQARRHLGDVFLALRLDGVGPVGRRRRPVAAHAVEQRRDAGADIADHRGGDLDVAVHLLGLDVDLDELLRRLAPGLALAVRQQPVEAGADQHARRRASFSTVERAAPAHCGCVSGNRPLAMLIGRKGMPLFSTRARIASSACA